MNVAVRTALNASRTASTALSTNRTAVRTALNTTANTARRLSNYDNIHRNDNPASDNNSSETSKIVEDSYNFEHIYIKNKEETLKYLHAKHKVVNYIVQCAAIRWVDTSPEVSVELMDFNGKQMVISKQQVINAINSGQIEVTNAILNKDKLALIS